MLKTRQVAGVLSLACAFGAAAGAAITETVLHNFTPPPKGATPFGLIADSSGNLYGTTFTGGSHNAGVVYKLDASGETVLYSFTGGADGKNPDAGVVLDAAGNLYGTTLVGGAANDGVVYMLDPAGHETVLHSFTGGTDGNQPQASVIRDTAGNLYGTTPYGGAANAGVVYKLDPAGNETILYTFTNSADGGFPVSALILSPAGNLYGTTQSGGTGCGYGCGVVFKLDPSGHESVLYRFSGGADGISPSSAVIRDAAGNLYGTTTQGGTGCGGQGCGIVYKLDAAGQETVLYRFTGSTDGGYPSGPVIRDSAGNLYGGSSGGGGTEDSGVVYMLDPTGHETVLYRFAGGTDGSRPEGAVIRNPAGNLYGTTLYGGPANLGKVFKIDAAGHETVLHSFACGPDGYFPSAGVAGDDAGNLYGTTPFGGPANAGVVYKIDATGVETALYSFTGGADGGNANSGVIRDSAGNLYGTTYYGGTANAGVVFRLDATGHETVLYSFTGGADGRNPNAGVIRDSAGNFYGATIEGGTGCQSIGCGVVFKLDATGHETVLHRFRGGPGGNYPSAGVIRDKAGNIFGTTTGGGVEDSGAVYKLDVAGKLTVLHGFGVSNDGREPFGGLIRDSAGNFYGTTEYGGTANLGVVFMLDPTGHETILHSFTGGADGVYPESGLIRDSAGNLYGTAAKGGTSNAGVVFMLNAAGQETVLYNFSGGGDGGFPAAGLIRSPTGDLFGTATSGGTMGGGVIFKLTTQ